MEKEIVCEAFAKVVNELVEAEVSKVKSEINLDSVLEFIKNANSEDSKKIFEALSDNSSGDEILYNYYENRLRNDSDMINKDDLTVSDVDEAGLLEDCYNEYLDNCYSVKDVIVDLLDRL